MKAENNSEWSIEDIETQGNDCVFLIVLIIYFTNCIFHHYPGLSKHPCMHLAFLFFYNLMPIICKNIKNGCYNLICLKVL